MGEECRGDTESVTKSIRHGKVRPPDGGWGWVIVFSAFMINVITDGCSYSFGVLYVFLLDYFQESRSTTAWIGSVFCAVPLLCGPIASVVTNRLGFRKATIIGGLITAIGFISSAFVHSVGAMAVTYGCIAGLGISMPYLNSIVVVAMYFEKKRTLATGISECGAGIGTLIFAPLYEYLIMSYSWRGAVLIIGAISLNIVVCGAVFKPLEDAQEYAEVQDSECDDKAFIEEDQVDRDNELLPIDGGFVVTKLLKSQEVIKSNPCLVLESISVLGASVATSPSIVRTAVSCHDLNESTKPPCKRINKPLIDISIFTNARFVLFTFSSIILYFWYDVPYVFTVDRAKNFGITEKRASYMVAVIGISHTLGNLLYGFLGDRKQINRRYLYSGSLLLTGVVLIIVPLFTTFLPCTILAGLFGLLSASAEALTSVIIVDILGIDKLTDAYGVVMFLQGVSNLVGPPVAGWLYDTSGSYDKTFYSAGSCISISGIIVFLTSLIKQKKEPRHEND
ncbi:monocarboxylate transporter 9-like [Mytilus edulis]|uniref:monocarboxylate transporter 9-like n=1 Tax=Mytilus edulis TaxID=6550 RepID=UPI0039EFA797